MSESTEKSVVSAEPAAVLDSQEIGAEELEKLKGDRVGDTLYSGKWILNTLLTLSKVQETGFGEELEKDLCTLWDMTTDKEIVNYLVENDFLEVAKHALTASEEPRLTEIVLGIIGNLSCEQEVLEGLATNEELVETIFRLLSSDDADILEQILRFLRSTLWNIRNDPKSGWWANLKTSTFLREVVPFILKSSTNEDLLIFTMSFLRTSTDIDLPDGSRTVLEELFEPSSLLSGLLEAFQEILPQEELQYCATVLKFLEDYVEVLSKCVANLEFKDEEDLLSRTLDVVRRITVGFVDPGNLFPFDETRASCLHRSVETIRNLRSRGLLRSESTTDPDRAVVNIMSRIKTATEEDENDPEDTMHDLLKYLEEYWIEAARIYTTQEVSKILESSRKEVVDYSLELLRTAPRFPAEKLEAIIRSATSKES